MNSACDWIKNTLAFKNHNWKCSCLHTGNVRKVIVSQRENVLLSNVMHTMFDMRGTIKDTYFLSCPSITCGSNSTRFSSWTGIEVWHHFFTVCQYLIESCYWRHQSLWCTTIACHWYQRGQSRSRKDLYMLKKVLGFCLSKDTGTFVIIGHVVLVNRNQRYSGMSNRA